MTNGRFFSGASISDGNSVAQPTQLNVIPAIQAKTMRINQSNLSESEL
jgi:hypothetical protein